MKSIDVLIIAIVAVTVGLVIWYIHRSRKKGVKCIGCPDAGKCAGNCCGCGNIQNKNN